jgi:ABC-2 type transport system ATP-binding protein
VFATLAGAGSGEVTTEDDLVRVPAGDGTSTLAEIVRRLDAAGVQARGLQLREPSLDDVFLSLTGHAAEHEGDPAGGRRSGPGAGSDQDGAAGGRRRQEATR